MTSALRVSLCALLGVLVSGKAVPAYAQEAVKVGYVDMQRAITETEEGKKTKANLKKIFDQKQKELDEQQEAVKKAIDDLDKKRTLLPPDTVRTKEMEIQAQMQKVQATLLRHQQDLQQKEQDAMAKILDRMQRIITKMATAENFTMIVEKTALVYAKPHLDLTNELVRRFNAGEEAGGKPPAAATSKKK